jgi:hypothetical protein
MTLRQFFCRHAHTRRERDASGVLMLVCNACDKATSAITRTAEDLRQWRTLRLRLSKSKRAIVTAKAVDTSKVTPMRRAK